MPINRILKELVNKDGDLNDGGGDCGDESNYVGYTMYYTIIQLYNYTIIQLYNYTIYYT